MTLVTVFNAFNPTEAEVIRSRLEASEFHAVISHGLAALSLEGYSVAAGGILVQVPEDEAESARALIDSAKDPSET